MEIYNKENIVALAKELYATYKRDVYKNISKSINYVYPFDLLLYDLNSLFTILCCNVGVGSNEKVRIRELLDVLHPLFLIEKLDDSNTINTTDITRRYLNVVSSDYSHLTGEVNWFEESK